MSIAAKKIIEALVILLEIETAEIKAGQLNSVADTAERKARLMHQLSRLEPLELSAGSPATQVHSLQNALRTNLRACRENIESIKELIELHLSIERDIENDGTYTMPVKLLRLT